MARHRTYSIEFKRQVALEFLGGEARATRRGHRSRTSWIPISGSSIRGSRSSRGCRR